MGDFDPTDYLSIRDAALLILKVLNICPSGTDIDKMYRRIQRMIHNRQIPFIKTGSRYFLFKKDVESLIPKMKNQVKVYGGSLSYKQVFEQELEKTPENPPTQSPVKSSIEKIENIIKLHDDNTISAKQALIIINQIIKNYKKA